MHRDELMKKKYIHITIYTYMYIYSYLLTM